MIAQSAAPQCNAEPRLHTPTRGRENPDCVLAQLSRLAPMIMVMLSRVGGPTPPQPELRATPHQPLRTTILMNSSCRVCRTIESILVLYTKHGPARGRARPAAAAAARSKHCNWSGAALRRIHAHVAARTNAVIGAERLKASL